MNAFVFLSKLNYIFCSLKQEMKSSFERKHEKDGKMILFQAILPEKAHSGYDYKRSCKLLTK